LRFLIGLAVAGILLWIAVGYTGPFLASHSRDHLNDTATSIEAGVEARLAVVLQDLGATTQYVAAVPDHSTGEFQGFVSGIKEAGLCARSVTFIATARLQDGRFVLDSVAPPRLQGELSGREVTEFGVLDISNPAERSTTEIIQVDLDGASERLIAFYEPVPGYDGSLITITAHRVDELVRDVVQASIAVFGGPADPFLITLRSEGSPVHTIEVNGEFGQGTKGLAAAQVKSVAIPDKEWEFQIFASKRYGITTADLLLSRVVVVAGLAIFAAIALAAIHWWRSMAQMADKVDTAEAKADTAGDDLALTNRQIDAVLESAQDGILLVDSDRRILWANPAFLRMFNVPDNNWEGKPSRELMAFAMENVPNRQDFQKRVDSIYADHRLTISNEEIQLTTSPTTFLSRSSSPVIDDAGSPIGRLWIYRDLSREHEARQAREAFVSMVSHELRTPLTAMQSSIELLTDGLAGELTDRQRSIASDALTGSITLARLVDDILAFSRASGGPVALEKRPFKIVRLLNQALDAVRAQHPATGHQIQVDVAPDLPEINADPQRVFQVLTNLLDNAFGYTPPGGSIRVQVTREQGRFLLKISDNGVGIPEEHQDMIWEPFQRAPVNIARPAGSTGLGLAVARSLVEAHQGIITVMSQPGEGSTFTVAI
jgi:signal transduction histidine kinase